MTKTDGVISLFGHPRALLQLLVAIIFVGATAAQSVAGTYVVRSGDTLKSIAATHGTTAAALVRANAIGNADVLQIGQRITIVGTSAPVAAGPAPAAASTAGGVTVRTGDTLGAIAARHNVSVTSLAAANGITNPNAVRVGTRLRIPATSGAPATAPQPSPVQSGSRRYRVRSGDSLWVIARRTGTTVAALARVNGLTTASVLQVGQSLRIPGAASSQGPQGSTPTPSPATGGVYTVRAGDTLGAIAGRYGLSLAALVNANGLTDPNSLRVGQRIRLTGGGTPRQAANPSPPVTAASAGWGTHPGRSQVAALLNSSARRYGVDPSLVRAVAWQESGWWQGARSHAGAMGVMQLMPATADWVGPAFVGRRIDATRAEDNIDGGTAYLAWLIRNSSTRDRAIASYYQGQGAVQRNGISREGHAYIRAVKSHYGLR